MILELILAVAIGQQKMPLAPVDEVQVVVEKVVDTKKVDELQKKVEDLQAQIDKLLAEKESDPIKNFKFVMSDRWGRKFANNEYDKLIRDVNYLNAQERPTSLGDRTLLPPPAQFSPEPQNFYMPQPQMQMGIGAAAANCAPGGT